MPGPRFLPPLLLAALALTPSCSDIPPDEPSTHIALDFSGRSGFFGAPFPNDARLRPDGTADLSGFPNPVENTLASRLIQLAGSTRGFGTTSAAFFRIEGKLAAGEVVGPQESVQPKSPIVLVSVSEGAPDRLQRYPISARFLEDAGPYGAPNLLAVLPVQGFPLRPATTYAVAIRNTLTDLAGKNLSAAPGMAPFFAGRAPEGMSAEVFAEHQKAIAALGEAGFPSEEIVGLTVFTTGAPTDAYERVYKTMLETPLPTPKAPFVRNEVFPDFCVYESTLEMPVYQGGEPPYSSEGGAWVFDATGKPVLQRKELANFVVTVPRLPMPAKGYPMVILSRTGAGGERPLVDRGVRDANGNALEPGTGPALVFAKAGFAGTSVDGPHGGLRNVTKGDEQFLVFNIGNPEALRDNVRQSAAELGLVAHVLDGVTIDIADCPGASSPDGLARFDPDKLAIFGHSMGASIVPLTAAFEPRIRALLLSGAGGSWLENVVHKQKPLATKPLAETIFGVAGSEYSLSEYDPMLNLLQWAGDAADVPSYTKKLLREANGAPRHVLMMQGIVDHYIMPPIANTMSLSLGLDLAGEALDETSPQLAELPHLGDFLPLGARKRIGLPASANVDVSGGPVTAVVVQHPEDGVEDGHEVVFQTEAPKHEMRCFLESFSVGMPRVPRNGALVDPCE